MNAAFLSKSWRCVTSYVIFYAESEFHSRQCRFCVLGVEMTSQYTMQLKLLMTNHYSTINSFLPVFSVANLFCFMLYCPDLQNMIEKSGVRVEKNNSIIELNESVLIVSIYKHFRHIFRDFVNV